MQINLNTPQQTFPLLSPIFQHTPMLSPLPEDTLRKYSYNYEEFGTFRLEACQDQNYLLFEIQQVPQQHFQTEQKFKQTKEEKKKCEIPIEKKFEKVMIEQVPNSGRQQKSEIEMENDMNSDSQKDSMQDKMGIDRTYSALEKLIHYLIVNLNKDENDIKRQALKDFQDKQTFSEIVSVLVKKFKKSRKTKEEMVKYCMRKAFKFIADKMKKNRTHNRDIDSCMRMYFSKNPTNPNFSIPFKKNSLQKTMNGSFLKRIFSSENFVDDYKEFLHDFQQLIEEDNYRKIKYLADMIETYLKSGQEKKIETIKRLPWTQDMLQQTLQLSKTLIEYAQKDSPLCTSKRRFE